MSQAVNTPDRAKRTFMLLGGLLLAVVVVAGAIYGPELYGMIQLGKQVDKLTSDNARLGGPWPRTSDACIFCHGYEGNARAQTYPRLAGQPEAYLKKQLKAFASGERNSATMESLAASMSDRELDGLAAHFAKMTPLPNETFHADATRAARGEALVKANNCAACHGQQLEGKDVFPRLAGQGHVYLRDQLTRFKSGARHDATGAMQAVAGKLSEQDIEDVAQFVASR
jgi:cytochrome c553